VRILVPPTFIGVSVLAPQFFDIQVLMAETRFECTETDSIGAFSLILERELQRRRDLGRE